MGYVKIYNSVLESKTINSTEKLIMGIITSLAFKESYCYANNEYFAQKLSVSKRTITKALSNLKKENLIYMETINQQRRIYLVENNNSIDIEENFATL